MRKKVFTQDCVYARSKNYPDRAKLSRERNFIAENIVVNIPIRERGKVQIAIFK